jgi:hypothetical protein
MPTNTSVGNWPFTVMAKAVRTRFSPDGSLTSVYRMTVSGTGQWHGFGCVAMASEAPEVSTTLDHTEINGRRCCPAEGSAQGARLPRGDHTRD